MNIQDRRTQRMNREEWILVRAYFRWIEQGTPCDDGVPHFLTACQEYEERWQRAWDAWNREAQVVVPVTVEPGEDPRLVIQEAVKSALHRVESCHFHNGFLMVWMTVKNAFNEEMPDWRHVDIPPEFHDFIRDPARYPITAPCRMDLKFCRYTPAS